MRGSSYGSSHSLHPLLYLILFRYLLLGIWVILTRSSHRLWWCLWYVTLILLVILLHPTWIYGRSVSRLLRAGLGNFVGLMSTLSRVAIHHHPADRIIDNFCGIIVTLFLYCSRGLSTSSHIIGISHWCSYYPPASTLWYWSLSRCYESVVSCIQLYIISMRSIADSLRLFSLSLSPCRFSRMPPVSSARISICGMSTVRTWLIRKWESRSAGALSKGWRIWWISHQGHGRWTISLQHVLRHRWLPGTCPKYESWSPSTSTSSPVSCTDVEALSHSRPWRISIGTII